MGLDFAVPCDGPHVPTDGFHVFQRFCQSLNAILQGLHIFPRQNLQEDIGVILSYSGHWLIVFEAQASSHTNFYIVLPDATRSERLRLS